MDRKDLEKLSRVDLVARAEELKITRPRTLTMPELIDEILIASEKQTGQKRPRGWFGRARDLLTSVIDRGTSNDPRKSGAHASPTAPPPLPTVTLAEIYAAQGHLERAITTLDEVIARDAAHAEAQRLRDRFAEQLRRQRPSSPPLVARPPTIPPPSASGSDTATPADTAADAKIETSSKGPLLETVSLESAAPGVTVAEGDLVSRYEVDEVVAIAVDPHTIYVYWEVQPTTLASAQATGRAQGASSAHDRGGAVTLRVISVTPGVSAPKDEARDIRVDQLDGELFVRDVPANTEVRVAIGWLEGGVFSPIAVGLDLATPRETPAEQIAVHFGRVSAGGGSDGYDALRGGGVSGLRPAKPTFGRATREEIDLGHAEEIDDLGRGQASVEYFDVDGHYAGEQRERLVRREVVTFRPLGASETLTRERRFFGASDVARDRGHSTSPKPPPGAGRGASLSGADVVSFAPRNPV